jgi:hypothetical protein
MITSPIKGVRNRVREGLQLGLAATQATGNAYRRATAAASQATMIGNYTPVDDVRETANKLMHIKVATSRTPVVPVREHVREPVISRMRMRLATEATGANVGGSNKKPLKKHLKKLVKKPIKKVVKKPLVKPAKKKVATRRISK